MGRTFPSAAGFITSELFFSDDSGTYFFPTRDFHLEIQIYDGKVNLEEFLSVHKKRIRKLSDKRLYIPRSEPYMDGHNILYVALQAQYIYDTYGKFPGTVQSIFCFMYVQAQHLDLDFYDHYFDPGAYLTTHKEHIKKWHSAE